MPKYISGRVKRRDQNELSSDRYRYLGLDQTEPNLGNPPLGGSSDIPTGDQYQVISVLGDDNIVNRYWIPVGGGIIPGSISVFDEGDSIGTANSITQLNFVGLAVSAIANPYVAGESTGAAATITLTPPGDVGSVLFKENIYDPLGNAGDGQYRDDFNTSSDLVFNSTVGILTVGKGLNVGYAGTIITAFSGLSGGNGIASVGIGSTIPSQSLDLRGNIRLSGDIYDFNNEPGTPTDILVKSAYGVEWTTNSAVRSGAGGDIGEIQFHDATGLVDGAENFVFIESTKRVGIGSTQPRVMLDVVGVASFGRLEVAGITTTYGLLDINAGGQASSFKVEDLTDQRVVFSGDGGELTDSPNFTFDNTKDELTVNGQVQIVKLNVTGVGTFGNVEIAGNDDSTIQTISGTNLILNADGGLVQINDNVYINDNEESWNFGSGSLIANGGGVFKKNVNVGGALSHHGPAPTDPVSVAATISGAGGITTTGGDLFVGGDLYIEKELILSEGNFQRLLVTGISTFKGVVEFWGSATGDAGVKSSFWNKDNNRLEFLDNSKLTFGDDQDLTVFFDGTDSKISNKTGELQIIGDRLEFKDLNDNQSYMQASVGYGVTLLHDNTERLKTTGGGVNVSGTFKATGVSTLGGEINAESHLDVAGISTFQSDVEFYGPAGVTSVFWDQSQNIFKFGDDVKATFGTGGDLGIYHDSDAVEPNSIIEHSNDQASALYLRSNKRVEITDESATNLSLRFNSTGNYETELFHGSTRRFATTGTGVSIYGALLDKDGDAGTNGQLLESTETGVNWTSAGDLTVQNANKIGVGSANTPAVYYPTFVDSNNLHTDRINENLFTQSAFVFEYTTPNTGRIGIGTDIPNSSMTGLNVVDGGVKVENANHTNSVVLNSDGGIELYRIDQDEDTKGGSYIDFKSLSSGEDYDARIQLSEHYGSGGGLWFKTGGNSSPSTSLVITTDGNVGIGTTIPTDHSHIDNTKILNVGIVTANKFMGGDYYGVFKGTIDPGVVLDEADKAKQIKTTVNDTDGTYHLTFVEDNNPAADTCYESLHTGAGITFNPSNNHLFLDGSFWLKGSDTTSGDIISDGGHDGKFGIFNAGSSHISLNVKDTDDEYVGIATFSAYNGFRSYFLSNVSPKGNEGNDLGDSATHRWNNVYAAKFWGDGSGLDNVGSPSSWTADDHENLTAGTNAGKSQGNNTCFNITVGYRAGCDNTDGDNNIFLGKYSGSSLLSGRDNVIIGKMAGCEETFGNENVFIGESAGGNVVGSCCNVAIGRQALDVSNPDLINNVAIGNMAGIAFKGDYSVAIGYKAGGVGNAIGNCNVLIGNSVEPPVPDGERQLVIGAGPSGNEAWIHGDFYYNVGIGTTNPISDANANNNAILNVGILTAYKLYGDGSALTGVSGGEWQQDANGNLVAGLDAGLNRGNGNSVYNIFVGENAGKFTDEGDANIFLGHGAGTQNTNGSHNIFLGCSAGAQNQGGGYNIAFGMCAGYTAESSTYSIYAGHCSGKVALGPYNAFFGNASGSNFSTGCFNVFIGHGAAHSKTSGCCNVIIGSCASTETIGITDNSRLVIGNPGDVWIHGDSSHNIGIGTYIPTDHVHNSNNRILQVGIVTANKFYGSFEGDIDGIGFHKQSGSFVAQAGVTVNIDSFAQATYDSAEYTIFLKNGTNIQSQKVLVMDDGGYAYASEYAVMFNPSQIVNITAEIVGADVKFKVTPLTGISGTVEWTWVRVLL